MKEHGPGGHPNQEFTGPEREQHRQWELLDGTNLLPEILKERMPALYSQEHERDPLVVVKYFDPVGSWTWQTWPRRHLRLWGIKPAHP